MRVKDLVKSQIEYANSQLARKGSFNNDTEEIDFKLGIIAMLEKLLHDTGNYNGFMFIDNNESDFGSPGYFSRKYFVNC